MKSLEKIRRPFKIEWLGYLGLLALAAFFGERLRWARFLVLLCVFFAAPYRKNLKMLFIVIFYSFCQVAAILRARGRLPRPEFYSQKTEFILPFSGLWLAVSGGVTREQSHSWPVFNQRYAYDFLIQDEKGCSHTGEGKKLEDYFCFGQPIYAPGCGVIVSAQDGIRDHPCPGKIDWGAGDFRGNFVIIQHEGGEYSHLAHFKKESLKVRPGDRVKAGQVIGLCGNSGHSLEPHLHFHVQDRPNFFLGLGLPVKFHDFVINKNGQYQRMMSDYVIKGQKVMTAGES